MAHRVTILCVFLVALAATHGHAIAITEYCPAEIGAERALGSGGNGPASLWSYTIEARGPRTVVGTIAVQADDGWYTFQFPTTVLTEADVKYDAPWATITRREFESSVLYVEFPHPIAIQLSWVSSVLVSNDVGFPWDTRHIIGCDLMPDVQPQLSGMFSFARLTPGPDLTRMPGPHDVIVHAVPTSAPAGFSACAQPFQGARATSLADVQFPPGLQITINVEAVVTVAVNANGALDDAWLDFPTGIPALDAEALRVARASTYASGVSLCHHAPGLYYYIVDFDLPR